MFEQGRVEGVQPRYQLWRWVWHRDEREDIFRREGMIETWVDPDEQKESADD